MFWILRRTGAANFFNSLNNNCSTSKANNNNSTQDKYVKRPPRKAYGRLSADSDDGTSMKHKIDDPFDDLENFEMITSASCSSNGNVTVKTTLSNVACAHTNGAKGGAKKATRKANDVSGQMIVGVCGISGCTGEVHCGAGADCQGNFINGNLCEPNLGICGRGSGSMAGASSGSSAGMTMTILKTNSAITGTGATTTTIRHKEVNENTINRLHAMAMSDDDDYDESLTCNVCDRAFHCHRQLASHQQKKRHFGCSGCDSLFPSLMLLEHHKEEFEHWSDDEIGERGCCRRNRGDDYFTDTDSYTSDAESEDLERLL